MLKLILFQTSYQWGSTNYTRILYLLFSFIYQYLFGQRHVVSCKRARQTNYDYIIVALDEQSILHKTLWEIIKKKKNDDFSSKTRALKMLTENLFVFVLKNWSIKTAQWRLLWPSFSRRRDYGGHISSRLPNNRQKSYPLFGFIVYTSLSSVFRLAYHTHKTPSST